MKSTSWFVPGRIEVLGKHTDYGGGRSLLAATEQGISFVGRRTPAGLVVEAPFAGAHYVDAVRRGLAVDYGEARWGAEVQVTTTLPAAAGLSSSSAFVTGLTLVLADLWELALPDDAALADYVAQLERGVGVQGGAEDHAAVLLARRDHLLPCRFRPTRPEPHVPWPADLVFVVAVSGVVAEKALGARERYNRTAGALATLEQRGIPLGALVDAPADIERHARELDLAAARRLRQFVEESGVIIPAAVAAIAAADWPLFGTLAARSHALAREALGNAVPETESLVERARGLDALAVSPFGAGFGGSVWAVVPLAAAPAFAARWWSGTTLITRPGNGAARLT